MANNAKVLGEMAADNVHTEDLEHSLTWAEAYTAKLIERKAMSTNKNIRLTEYLHTITPGTEVVRDDGLCVEFREACGNTNYFRGTVIVGSGKYPAGLCATWNTHEFSAITPANDNYKAVENSYPKCPCCGADARRVKRETELPTGTDVLWRIECSASACGMATRWWYPLAAAEAAWSKRDGIDGKKPMRGVWYPIHTAPKDGRHILLAGPSGYTSTPLRAEICYYSQDKQDWRNHAGDSFSDGGAEPTLWALLT